MLDEDIERLHDTGYLAKAGYDYATEFAFGLDLILEGLDTLRDA